MLLNSAPNAEAICLGVSAFILVLLPNVSFQICFVFLPTLSTLSSISEKHFNKKTFGPFYYSRVKFINIQSGCRSTDTNVHGSNYSANRHRCVLSKAAAEAARSSKHT